MTFISNAKYFLGTPFAFRLVKPMLEMRSYEYRILCKMVQSGNVVFDVGANTGGYSILFANLVGGNGSVHAFEPIPSTFAALSKNVSRARLSGRISTNRCAIGDHNGLVQMNLPDADSTEASMVRHNFASWGSQRVKNYSCELKTIDTYVRERGLDKVDFVNIDVEGGELLVLGGMKSIMAKPDAPNIMLEMFPIWMRDYGFKVEDVFDLFSNFGYGLYFIGHDRLIACKTPGVAKSLIAFPQHLNFLAIRKAVLPM